MTDAPSPRADASASSSGASDTPQATVVYVAHSAQLFVTALAPLVEAVQAQGFQVVVMAAPDGAEATLHTRGVETIALPVRPTLSLARDPAAWVLITSALIQRRPLMVQSFSASLHLTAALAAQTADVPIRIAALTDLDLAGADASPVARALAQAAAPSYWRALAGATHAWLAFSAESHAFAQRHQPPELHLLDGAPGVDLMRLNPDSDFCPSPIAARAQLGLPPEVSAWVGCVGPARGVRLERLERLCAALARSGAGGGLIVVDDGPPLGRAAAARRLRAAAGDALPLVILRDRDEDERALVYAALDAVVEPGPAPPLHAALHEAAAMRLPAIAADDSDPLGVIDPGRTGHTVAQQQLAAKLVETLRSTRLRHSMGAAARARATARLDRERHHLQLFSLYDALIQARLGQADADDSASG